MPPPPSPRAVHYTTHASILRPCAEPQGCRGAFHSFILAAAAAFADSPRPGARPASVPHHYQGVAVVCRVQAAVVQARRRNGPSVALPASRRTEASPPPPLSQKAKKYHECYTDPYRAYYLLYTGPQPTMGGGAFSGQHRESFGPCLPRSCMEMSLATSTPPATQHSTVRVELCSSRSRHVEHGWAFDLVAFVACWCWHAHITWTARRTRRPWVLAIIDRCLPSSHRTPGRCHHAARSVPPDPMARNSS